MQKYIYYIIIVIILTIYICCHIYAKKPLKKIALKHKPCNFPIMGRSNIKYYHTVIIDEKPNINIQSVRLKNIDQIKV